MNYFKDVISPHIPAPSSLRARAAAALAVLAAGAAIAGCGSSGESSTITIGNENKADNSLITVGNPELPAIPTTGPLSTEPKVTGHTGAAPTTIVTHDIVVGTGKEATKGSTVYVDYVGALYKNGKVFDASWRRREPFHFTIGTGETIKGWEEGVVGMKEGGRRELLIPSSKGYGKLGSGEIPPNEALVFVVDLLKVKG